MGGGGGLCTHVDNPPVPRPVGLAGCVHRPSTAPTPRSAHRRQSAHSPSACGCVAGLVGWRVCSWRLSIRGALDFYIRSEQLLKKLHHCDQTNYLRIEDEVDPRSMSPYPRVPSSSRPTTPAAFPHLIWPVGCVGVAATIMA